MTPVTTRIVLIAGCCLMAGCATPSRSVTTYKPADPKGIVIVVNGGGGLTGTSDALAKEIKNSRAPLYVRTHHWSHGVGQIVDDMTDEEHAQCEARQLADTITAYRSRFPDMPLSVVAHSAGTYIALEAMKSLPPDSIDELMLLAPAVSANYDLRPALVAAKRIDSFSSHRDGIFLGFGTSVLGTADGDRSPAAGRVGFDPPKSALSFRLQQHPWDPSVRWTGNNGSHDGMLRPKYLRAFVLPLLAKEPEA